jgi:hypothetical protein
MASSHRSDSRPLANIWRLEVGESCELAIQQGETNISTSPQRPRRGPNPDNALLDREWQSLWCMLLRGVTVS